MAVGKTARPTVTVCVRDRKDRVRTPAPGTSDSKYPASTPGPGEIVSPPGPRTCPKSASEAAPKIVCY